MRRAPWREVGPFVAFMGLMAGSGVWSLSCNHETPPKAAFSGSPRSGTAPLTVQFTDASNLGTGGSPSWLWDFGDGKATSTAQSPQHQYTSPGTYTVSLTVNTSVGSDTETKTGYITVSAAPVGPTADFTADPTSGTAPLEVHFQDTSAPGTSPITTWLWDFGDGKGTSGDEDPTHEYTEAGTYTVSLTVTTSVGSDTETKAGYITVEQAAGQTALTVINDSSLDMVAFHMAPSEDKDKAWGPNLLSAMLLPGEGENIGQVAAGDYDLRSVLALSGEPTSTSDMVLENAAVGGVASTDFRITDVGVSVGALGGGGPDWSFGPTSGEAPLDVRFIFYADMEPCIRGWRLESGDGNTRGGPGSCLTFFDTEFGYDTPGTYTVRLVIAYDSGSNTYEYPNAIVVYRGASGVGDYCDVGGSIPMRRVGHGRAGDIVGMWEWDCLPGGTSAVMVFYASGVLMLINPVTHETGSYTWYWEDSVLYWYFGGTVGIVRKYCVWHGDDYVVLWP